MSMVDSLSYDLNDQIQSGDDGVCVHKARSLLSRFKLADRNF